MSKISVNCEWCQGLFTARIADRKRGWARFCSKTCKAKEQEKRTGQNRAYQQNLPDRLGHMEDIDHEGGGWDAHKDIR